MRKRGEAILATYGNLPLVAAGTDIFIQTKARTAPFINVLPGQGVFYDPVTNKAVTGAGVTQAVYKRLVFAVGIDTNGDGMTDILRKPFGDEFRACAVNAATAEPPRCGVPEIVDVLFKCTKLDEPYTLSISIEDDQTQNEFPFNRPANYTYTAELRSDNCVGCTTEEQADKVACALVDAITLESYRNADVSVQGRPTPWDGADLPFYAVRLFEHSVVFCLNPVAGACDTCTEIAAITGISIDGVDTLFTNSVNPANIANTLQGQLMHITNQINTILAGTGTATVTRGAGSCCTYNLEINTCNADTIVLLNAAGADVVPCSTTNPLAPITIDPTCIDCTPESGEVTFPAGIRLIAKPVLYTCSGYPANPPKGYLGRTIRARVGSGFDNATTYIRKAQAMELPENWGYHWQWREYASGIRQGHRGSPYNTNYGSLGLPGGNSRLLDGTVKCNTGYCSYILEHDLVSRTIGAAGPYIANKGRTVILIPSADTTTRTAFELAINAWIAAGACTNLSTITCGSDQDQDNDSTPYNDLNGRIR